jgi:hypothetical protein
VVNNIAPSAGFTAILYCECGKLQIASSHSGQECMVNLLKVTFAAGVLLLTPLAVAAQGDTLSLHVLPISPLAPLASPPQGSDPNGKFPRCVGTIIAQMTSGALL